MKDPKELIKLEQSPTQVSMEQLQDVWTKGEGARRIGMVFRKGEGWCGIMDYMGHCVTIEDESPTPEDAAGKVYEAMEAKIYDSD